MLVLASPPHKRVKHVGSGALPSWFPSAGSYVGIGANTFSSVGGTSEVMRYWNSGAYASDLGAYGAGIVHGSGHPTTIDSGQTNNGVYAFTVADDPASCLWSCLKARTPANQIPANAAADSFGLWPDLQPAAAHTYDALSYIPGSAAGNAKGTFMQARLTAFQQDGFGTVNYSQIFDINAASWDHSTNVIPANAATGRFGSLVYDPSRGCAWWLDSGQPTHVGKYNPLTKAWTSIAHGNGSINLSALYLTGGYCPALDVVVWWYSNQYEVVGSGILIIFNPNTNTLTWDAPTSGSKPVNTGIEWCPHPSIQKFYGMEFGYGGGDGVCTISIASPCVITRTAHGLSNGMNLWIGSTGSLPSPLSPSVAYYVKNATANTFEISTTPGGASVNTSGSQSGTQYLVYAYALPICRTLTPPVSLGGTWVWGSETFAPQGGVVGPGNDSENPVLNRLRWMNPTNSPNGLPGFIWCNADGQSNVFRPAGT